MDKPITENRFWARVDTCSDITQCWPWTGGLDKDGYGIFVYPGKPNGRSHVYAWERTHESVPCVCHHCDHPWCCNDTHMFGGTPRDNAIDRHIKGRSKGCLPGEGNHRAKLTLAQVLDIRVLGNIFTHAELGKKFGVSRQTIGKILRLERWRVL